MKVANTYSNTQPIADLVLPTTRKQAEVAEILSDILFKGLALIVVLVLLVAGFIVFVYAVLKLEKPVATSVLGGLDLLLGVLLRQVYASLFRVDAPNTAPTIKP